MMLTGPGLNWWSMGGADPAPPGPSDFWTANTGTSGMAGGDIDLMSWFITIVNLGVIYGLS